VRVIFSRIKLFSSPSDRKQYGGGYMTIEQAWASARTGKVFWWCAVGLFLLERTADRMDMGTIGTLSAQAVLIASFLAAVQIGKATRLIGRSEWWWWAVGSFILPIVFWFGYYHVMRVARPNTEVVKYAENIFALRYW
jgi:hypothetical protein